MNKEKSMETKENKWTGIVVFSVCLVLLIFEIFWFNYSMNKRMIEIENEICILNNKSQAVGSIEQTEYMKAIEYLEAETTKYRGFVEKQQDYLVWLIGLVGTGFLAFLGFLAICSGFVLNLTLIVWRVSVFFT